MQPIKELSSAAGWCAGRGCALIRQLANTLTQLSQLTCKRENFLFPDAVSIKHSIKHNAASQQYQRIYDCSGGSTGSLGQADTPSKKICCGHIPIL